MMTPATSSSLRPVSSVSPTSFTPHTWSTRSGPVNPTNDCRVTSGTDLLKPGGKMAKHRRLLEESVSPHALATGPDLENRLHHVVHMTLGIHSARNGQPHQLHGPRRLLAGHGVAPSEHDRPDLDGPDPRFTVELDNQRLSRQLQRADVGEEGGGVDVDRVAARRLHDGDAGAGDVLAQEGGRWNAIRQLTLAESIVQADPVATRVAPPPPAISGEALRQDQQIA